MNPKTDNTGMVLRSVYLTPELDEQVRLLAFQLGKGKGEVIRMLIVEALVRRPWNPNPKLVIKSPSSLKDKRGVPPVRDYSPKDVRRIRKDSGATPMVFATLLNIDRETLAAWEKGTARPAGPDLRLLDIVERKGIDVLR